MADDGNITIDVLYDEHSFSGESAFDTFYPLSDHNLSYEQRISKALERLEEWNRGPAKAQMFALLQVHRDVPWLEYIEIITPHHQRFYFVGYHYKSFAEDFCFFLYSLGALIVRAHLHGYECQLIDDDSTKRFEEEFVLRRSQLWNSTVGVNKECSSGRFGEVLDEIRGADSRYRLAAYQKVTDKQMVGSFYSIAPDGKSDGVNVNFLNTTFNIVELTASYLVIAQHASLADKLGVVTNHPLSNTADNDLIASIYVNTAKVRGNRVRSFTSTITRKIDARFKKPGALRMYNGVLRATGNALLEFDSSGKVISFLVRSSRTLSADQTTLYTLIFMGDSNAKFLEQYITKSELQENFVREF